ncbi:LysR family transcriptional regulator [Luteolibacter pohnpeiensis]|uniref:LysR family transcriptional regulator n=1 Tax=Luteolibacter pohnpeiensis TaxID=454153 RepID=A0A934VTA5_9BACT|nr:LysR family transcriptional regulator [Luteolibacter pohnpeiensis]MBK1881287.1 LysR family transcriptional regulator [Luteolibacter pohnpeiensis]
MNLPEIRELQVFLALARTGSFSSAAKQLGVTQPAISAQIAKLEQEIGFSLFYRSPEGTMITDQGKALIPLVEEIEREHSNLLRRASYWKRSRTKSVKIWLDGSRIAQHARSCSTGVESWHDLLPGENWIDALKNFEVDIVVCGSFLKSADVSGIGKSIVYSQSGATVTWNPAFYGLKNDRFSFPDALDFPTILPSQTLAYGFREFISDWCQTAYRLNIEDVIECESESDAIDICKLGLGVMMFPGDTDTDFYKGQTPLNSAKTFEFVLPSAFVFAIRHRAEEQNPLVMKTVAALHEALLPLAPSSS